MRKLQLTTAKDRYDRGIKTGSVSWESLAKKLTNVKRTDESFEDYKTSDNKLAIKDTGWFIGGPMVPAARRKANLQHRDVLTLDADHLDPWDVGYLIDFYDEKGFEFVCHSSHSHSDEEPRLRFVFPLSRSVEPEEYEPIARGVAGEPGIDFFDDTTFQVSRVMFWPSASSDGDVVAVHVKGQWLDPDAILEQYDNWRDWGEWPQSSRASITRDPNKQAASPYEKPGVIGAFNRHYEVPHAIEEFDLPYAASGMGEDRYSYLGGSSVDGAIYYPDDGHLYSWHESDPARGNHNAWDLVRIHLFGDKDAGLADDTAVGSLPSQKAMQAFAMGLEPIAKELAAAEGFEVLPPEEPGSEPDGDPDIATGVDELSFDGIHAEIMGRSAPFGREERTRVLRHLAAASLPAAETDTLVDLLKDACDVKVTKKALVDDMKSLRGQMMSQTTDGTPTDIQFDLMERVLDDWFGGGEHIKRFGRQFWVYEHGVWQQREDEHVKAKMMQSFLQLKKDRPRDALALVAAVGSEDTSTMVSKLWAMFCAFVNGLDSSKDPMQLRELDKRPVINVLNGHIEFNRRGQVRLVPHDPKMFLTSQVPVEYDPKADTTHWDAFCRLIFHGSEDTKDNKRHLEEVAGYVLQPWRDLPSVFIMRGEPAAGKSTFGMVVNRLLGDNVVNQALGGYDGNNTHAAAGLVGKLLLMDEDYAYGELLPDGFLKRISEAKYMTANPKNKDEFEFICRAVPLIITNEWPRTRDHSGALDRRLLAWDLHSIPKDLQDDNARRALLRDGLAGALRRFVDGFARLYERDAWDVPLDCAEAANQWHLESDIVAYWLETCFEYDPHSTKDFIERKDMWGLFREYLRDTNMGKLNYGKHRFMQRLTGHLAGPVKHGGYYGWTGLKYLGSEFYRLDGDD